MIGLGSNRLTVCRRGGMSVTQAGRGGMEWLAGGRRPRWSSPYSAQATVYLKQHYAAYWSEIADYGKRNPTMVPWINEDPDMVCSLVNVGKVRCLVSDGACWIDSGIYNPNGFHLKAQAYLISNDNQFSPIACMSNIPNNTQRNYFGVDSGGRYWAGWGQYEYNQGAADFGLAEWEFNSIQSSSDKSMKRNGSTIFTIGSNTYSSDSSITNVMLFGRVTNGSLARHWHGGIGTSIFLNDTGDMEIARLVPCESEGVKGMLNITTNTFRPKQGSGSMSFTISETPAS